MSTTTNIPSFDALVEKYKGDNAVATAATRTKIKKEAELSAAVAKARIEAMDAEAALETAIITDGKDIATAAANKEKADRTLAFYTSLYNSVFPNA